MRRSSIVQISLAIFLSLTAGVLIFRWMQAQQGAPVQAPAVEKVMVAVAARDIKKGTKLAPEHVRVTPYLPESLPGEHFSEPEALAGRVLSADIKANEPITSVRLVGEGEHYAGVSTMIAPGKRALAVKGNKVLGLAGFIRPGNRVDVLVTIDDERRCGDKSVSKIVLENIRVLATGTELQAAGEDGETSPVDTYTLEISPDEGEKLALAATRGTLHFALRNPADGEEAKTPGANVPGILGGGGSRRVAGKTEKAPPPYTVEVITGGNRSVMRF